MIISGIIIAAILITSIFAINSNFVKAATAQAVELVFVSVAETAGCNQHWDKIIFKIIRDPSGQIPLSLLKTELDIKVLDNPIKVADVKGKVRDYLTTGRIVEPQGINIPPLTAAEASALQIEIVDVEYAIVLSFDGNCPVS